jgi:hypothetical protein
MPVVKVGIVLRHNSQKPNAGHTTCALTQFWSTQSL